MAMKPNNTHDPNIINFNYDADEELYVSDPVDVPALKKNAVTFRFDLQTLGFSPRRGLGREKAEEK